MPLTAVFLLPPSQSTSLPTILSHITLTFPCKSLLPFTLTHHLFTSTSSLLPDPPHPWPPTAYSRSYLSVLTLSTSSLTTTTDPTVFPQQSPPTQPTTFITTSTPSPLPSTVSAPGPAPTFDSPDYNNSQGLREKERLAKDKYERDLATYHKQIETCTTAALAALKYDMTSITVPTAQIGGFMELLSAKMTPLWAPRGSERVEGGTALELRDGEWKLRIGELRVDTRKAGQGAGMVTRGVLCELTWLEGEDEEESKKVGKEEEAIMKGFLERLLEGTGVKIDGVRSVYGYTATNNDKSEGPGDEPDWALAEIYTELLRTRT